MEELNSLLALDLNAVKKPIANCFKNANISSSNQQVAEPDVHDSFKWIALLSLVTFIKFKKREKHPRRSVTFSKNNTPLQVFFTFFKLYKWYQIAQSVAYEEVHLLK